MCLKHTLAMQPRRCADGWRACEVGMAKEGVNVWQQRVAAADGITDAGGGRLSKQPRLSPRGFQVCMTTEEGVVRPELYNRNLHFFRARPCASNPHCVYRAQEWHASFIASGGIPMDRRVYLKMVHVAGFLGWRQHLVPPRDELSVRVAEESAHVSTCMYTVQGWDHARTSL